MDQATLSGLIKSFGAADTPENTNRIRGHYASDPAAAERRLTGAQGQSDESGGSRDAILNSMLDKALGLTANTVPASVEATTVPVMDTVRNANVQTKRSATAGSRGSPNMEPQMQTGFNDLTETTSPTIGKTSGNPLDWLIPLLIGGAATGTMMRSPPTQKASPRAIDNEGKLIEGANPSQKQLGYTPQLEDQDYGRTRMKRNTTLPSGAPELGPYDQEGKKMFTPESKISDKYQSPQDIARMQAEVEAENASANALKEQMMQQTQRQKSTSDLGKAARRATGRK